MFSGFFRTIIFSSIIASGAFASNYPTDFYNQRARLINFFEDNGSSPAFIANVTSGIMDKVVFGYRYSGKLAASNPNSVDAVVLGKCITQTGVVVTKKTDILIGREWHNKGYMSAPHDFFSFFDLCGLNSNMELAVAFSDGKGNWDPGNGVNYSVTSKDFYGQAATVYESYESGGGDPNLSIWKFLVGKLW